MYAVYGSPCGMIFLMRFIAFLLVFLGSAFFFGEFAQAADLVPCSGASCSTCDVVKVANGVVGWLAIALASIGGLVLMFAGVKMVTSAGNMGAIESAKEMMVNVIIGYLILLSAWLVIDTVMKTFVGDEIPGYGPWNEIECSTSPKATPFNVAPSGGGGGGGVAVNPGSLVQCPVSNSACSPAALQAAGFTQSQANVMSCIAITESSGDPSKPPFNETNPNVRPISTACGLFQITQSTWNDLRPSGACADWRSNCQNAACNTQVAKLAVQRRGYQPWLCPTCNSKAQGCVDKYGQ